VWAGGVADRFVDESEGNIERPEIDVARLLRRLPYEAVVDAG
jgi:hypothetical protein